jgi:tRNA(adenine34) deaminase
MRQIKKKDAKKMTKPNRYYEAHMATALILARRAWQAGDWPVGAVIFRDEKVLSTGRGRQNSALDPTAHAETDALKEALLSGEDLRGATICCTMEPCPMCAHALHLHGINCIVLGARHLDLGRSDLGTYTLESLAEMMGYSFVIVNNVARTACISLRQEWGADQVLPLASRQHI